MALRGGVTVRFTPRGVYDALDGTDAPQGAMAALSNLVPDPSTQGCFLCRAAVTKLTAFAGFSSPGAVAVAYQLGTRVYGLVATVRNSGKDEPFVFDVPTSTFITVTGVTGATCPATQATSGNWTPPTMALVSTKLMVTHPGFPGAGTNFGWFDISNPAAPTWNAGNTATNALPSVPVAVAQFNGRAWYGLSSGALWFSDVLVPTTITNASNTLQLGDTTAVTALAQLGLTTTSGGVVQGLITFKATSTWQVTGDITSSTLALNVLSPAVGTLAPRTVVNSPAGVSFMANDGIRLVTPAGAVSNPIDGVQTPFQNALYPSRAAAAYSSGIYRVCVQNGAAVGVPFQDYWYDFPRGVWTGPHTFSYGMAVPYLEGFILASNAAAALPALWFSEPRPAVSSNVSTENGSPLYFSFKTPPLPSNEKLYANSMVDTSVNMSFGPGYQQVSVAAEDENGTVLASATVLSNLPGPVWGAFSWGTTIWGGTLSGLKPQQIAWDTPVVFSKVVMYLTGAGATGLRISNLQAAYQPLRYML